MTRTLAPLAALLPLVAACAGGAGPAAGPAGAAVAAAPGGAAPLAAAGGEVPGWSPEGAGLCDGAPADLRGATVLVDRRGLWLAPHAAAAVVAPRLLDPLAADERPRSPLTLPDGAAGGPAIALAVARPDTCALRLYDAAGAALGAVEVDATTCLNPSRAGTWLVWPTGSGASSGRLAWIDPDAAAELAAVELDGPPVTPAVAFGSDLVSGGGSHWLVGVHGGVLAVRGPALGGGAAPGAGPASLPAVVGRWDAGPWRVTSLTVASDTAAVTLAAAGEAGMGSHLRLLRATADEAGAVAFAPASAVLAAPGALTAHPVGAVCDADTAGLWYCEGAATGAVVAGGAGWLAGWSVPDGAPRFVREQDATWTSLALGRGGWVAGGGSHWFPSGAPAWQLLALDPADDAAPTLLAGQGGDACVPSPLWDSNGDLAAPVSDGEPPRVVRSVLPNAKGGQGLARGPARPHGDARNGSSPVARSEACDDGVLRGLTVEPLGAREPYELLHAGGRTVVVGGHLGSGFVRWLPDGGPAAEITIPEAYAVERALPRPGDEVVVAFFEAKGTGAARVAAYQGGPTPLWSHPLAGDLGAILGLAPGATGEVLVATRQGETDQVARVDEALGEVDARTFGAADGGFGLERLVADGQGGAFMVLGQGDRVAIRRVDAALDDAGFATWVPGAPEVGVVDATSDGQGVLRVLAEARDGLGGYSLHWLRYAPDLASVEETLVPYGGFFATRADGASLMATDQGLVRVSPDGAVGAPRPVGAGLEEGLSPALRAIAATDDGFVSAYWRGSSGALELVWGRADALGFLACGEAGACVGQPEDACDLAGPCEALGCSPVTGACEAGPATPACAP